MLIYISSENANYSSHTHCYASNMHLSEQTSSQQRLETFQFESHRQSQNVEVYCLCYDKVCSLMSTIA